MAAKERREEGWEGWKGKAGTEEERRRIEEWIEKALAEGGRAGVLV